MTTSIGEKIIAAINSGGPTMLRLDAAFRDGVAGPDGYTVWIAAHHWRPNAAEQLEAVVEAHIEERVKERFAEYIRSTCF